MTTHQHAPHPGFDTTGTPQEVWNKRYGTEHIWSGNANAVLVRMVSDFPAGRALDLGCGEGGDSAWLAARGWRVTGVDVSDVALDRARKLAAELDVSDRITFERHDLAESFPDGTFDLISAQFFHSPMEFPRARILRTAAEALAPGGVLLVVDHGAAPPWARDLPEDVRFPSAQEVVDELDLDESRWRAERIESAEREAVGPGGETGMLLDNIILIRRVG